MVRPLGMPLLSQISPEALMNFGFDHGLAIKDGVVEGGCYFILSSLKPL
jgi:hypothetical protein